MIYRQVRTDSQTSSWEDNHLPKCEPNGPISQNMLTRHRTTQKKSGEDGEVQHRLDLCSSGPYIGTVSCNWQDEGPFCRDNINNVMCVFRGRKSPGAWAWPGMHLYSLRSGIF